MPKNQSKIEQQLNGIFSRRVAHNTTDSLYDKLGVDWVDELKGKRVPATLCTDLKHAAPKAVARFEKWLNSHGAVLVR